MTVAPSTVPDRSALVYRYHERLYRLALLVVGDATAAGTVVQHAYRSLPTDFAELGDPEYLLIRSLLAKRRNRDHWRWTANDDERTRATLDQPHATALLDLLAKLTPAARLVIGMHEILGWSTETIATCLGTELGTQTPANILIHTRVAVARTLNLVPAETDTTLLLRIDQWLQGQLSESDALDLRRSMLEQPGMRALRDGMIATRDLLPRAIPALFAAMPPLPLTERLLTLTARPAPAHPKRSVRPAQLLLAIGVFVLAAAIIWLPALFSRPAAPTVGRTLSATDIIEAAIHRFDQAPLQHGVLHEQYRLAYGNRSAYLFERWYDYGTPNRLSFNIQQAGNNNAQILQISTDGRNLVQFRNAWNNQRDPQAIDAHIDESQVQALIPLLRGQALVQSFMQPLSNPNDVGPFYLAQARAANAQYLGQTTLLNRTALLLTYHTNNATRPFNRQQTTQPAQVLLTIDQETFALLDVALISDGAAESSAQHPFQAQVFELLDSVPDERFTLPSDEAVVQRNDLVSVRLPTIDETQLLTLDAAAQRTNNMLFAPQQLPDSSMRGLAFATSSNANSQDVVLLYEGEFQNVMLMAGGNYPISAWSTDGTEHSIGDFRYRLIREMAAGNELSAIVYRADMPDQPLILTLNDDYATSEERTALLESMIASLTPVNAQSLPQLQRNFQALGAAEKES